MDRFSANEPDYHQRVIRHLATFPDMLKARLGLETFVWGHEIDLHDAGRGGGNGPGVENFMVCAEKVKLSVQFPIVAGPPGGTPSQENPRQHLLLGGPRHSTQLFCD